MRADKSADQYDWVNLVKLVGMCLIVLYHARRSIEAVGWHDTSLAIAVSDAFILTLVRPFAIPGFFLASGVLVAASLGRDWKSVHAARIDRFFYLFYLWGAIYALTIPVYPFAEIDLEQTAARLVSLIAVDSHAWYVWATAAFFVVAWAMRRWPGWAAVAATVVFSVTLPPIAGKVSHPVQEMVRCLPYFMFAVRYPRIPQAIAADATALRLIVLLLAYASSLYWLVMSGIHHTIVTGHLACRAGDRHRAGGAALARLCRAASLVRRPNAGIIPAAFPDAGCGGRTHRRLYTRTAPCKPLGPGPVHRGHGRRSRPAGPAGPARLRSSHADRAEMAVRRAAFQVAGAARAFVSAANCPQVWL